MDIRRIAAVVAEEAVAEETPVEEEEAPVEEAPVDEEVVEVEDHKIIQGIRRASSLADWATKQTTAVTEGIRLAIKLTVNNHLVWERDPDSNDDTLHLVAHVAGGSVHSVATGEDVLAYVDVDGLEITTDALPLRNEHRSRNLAKYAAIAEAAAK